MAELVFKSKGFKDLRVDIKPNQIEWGYNLNVNVTPTYGGEVVQILSAYIDKMTITGNVRTYKKAEEIYQWFLSGIQRATQDGQFKHQKGIDMYYPERGWHFRLLPLTLAKLKYSLETVAPEWSINCQVIEPAQDALSLTMDQAAVEARESETGIPLFGLATGNIGWEEDDPFRSPIGDAKLNQFYKDLIGGETVRYQSSDLGDWFNSLIPSYLEGNFDDLTADYSRPSMGQSTTGHQNQGPGNRNEGITDAAEKIRKGRTGD
jgi:hypothetical protein